MSSNRDNMPRYSSSEPSEDEEAAPEKSDTKLDREKSEGSFKKSSLDSSVLSGRSGHIAAPADKDISSRDKHSDRHRRKDRHEKHSKRHKRRSSRDDRERSKRRHKDEDDDYPKSRRDKDRKESRSERRRSRSRSDKRSSKHKKDRRRSPSRSRSRSNDRRVKDKYSRKSDERKNKRSRTPEKSSRRRSSSSSPERVKKLPVKPAESPISKPSTVTSASSSPQKSPMISLTAATITQQPTEPKIELPSYYNPNVINVTKFAEQQKKRKMIWSGKKDEPAKDAAKWGGAKFSQDVDGTKASKFMRLMGIKEAPKPEATAAVKPSDELFSTMEQQYEVARQVTHISRGVGLGFGSRPF